VPVVAVAAMPLRTLILEPSTPGNAFGLLPFFRLSLEIESVRAVAIALAVAAVVAALTLPARWVTLAVGAYLLAANVPVVTVLRNQSLGVRELAALDPAPSWIDAKTDRRVAYLNTSNYAPETLHGDLWSQWAPVWEAEFWNRRLNRVISLDYPEPAPLPQIDAKLDWATGRIAGARASFVVADERFHMRGRLLARRGKLVLWRASAPFRLASMQEGVTIRGRLPLVHEVAAYTSWVPKRELTVFVITPRDATITVGSLDASSGVGKIGTVTRTWRVRGKVAGGVTLVPPRAPFRIEVAVGQPGSVSFT
jgi:hypothetical protein